MAAEGGQWEPDQPAELVSLDSIADWTALAKRYDPNRRPKPLLRCLEVAEILGAKTAVIEYRYHDGDYRSEYAAFFAKVFPSVPDTVHRILFFRARLTAENLLELPEDAGFVGYVTVRPTALGRVGRTMLAPPPDIADAVLTTVEDEVHLFGQRLTVEGMPFIQQDKQLGVCAHAASWMCHRLQALGGIVARRPSADFSLHADASTANGRMLPSAGLTARQIAGILRDFGLPPIWYRMGAMPDSDPDAVPPEPPVLEDGSTVNVPPGKWDTRAIAVACRHLNSGFAVLVGTNEHAFVLCGYSREPREGEEKDRITFIRHDDQNGPYLKVGDIRDDYDEHMDTKYDPWELFLVPVPDDLWLQPEAAELRARIRLAEMSTWANKQVPSAESDIIADLIANKAFSLRTYAITSSDYKARLADRGLDDRLIREFRLANLSRIVWVVETIDRRERIGQRPCIVGEAIFDCTSADDDPAILGLWINGAAWLAHVAGQPRGPFAVSLNTAMSGARYQPR